jgi:hypothetical protein
VSNEKWNTKQERALFVLLLDFDGWSSSSLDFTMTEWSFFQLLPFYTLAFISLDGIIKLMFEIFQSLGNYVSGLIPILGNTRLKSPSPRAETNKQVK